MSDENQNQSMVVNGQREMFGGLFKPSDETLRAKSNKSGGIRVSLLPEKSKNGQSLKSVLGLTGAALQAARVRLQGEMKQRIGGLTGIVGSSEDWTGVGYSINAKRNRITATWSLRSVTSKETLKASMTDEEVLELAIARGIADAKPVESVE